LNDTPVETTTFVVTFALSVCELVGFGFGVGAVVIGGRTNVSLNVPV